MPKSERGEEVESVGDGEATAGSGGGEKGAKTDGDVGEVVPDEAGVIAEEGASCWICFDGGPDEGGKPLRRDCSCRGPHAGFAHLSCLVECAKHVCRLWDGRDGDDRRDVEKIVTAWVKCKSCGQFHQNELAMELASAFVALVDAEYQGDWTMQLTALHSSMVAHENMDRREDEDVKKIATKIFSVTAQMKSQGLQLSEVVHKIEALAYSCLGDIALEEGTKKSAELALGYLEKCQDICKAKGWDCWLSASERNIYRAKLKIGGSSSININEHLKRCREVYESSVNEYGQDASATIGAGYQLADALVLASHVIEAEKLLTDLATICNRVHGPNHRKTKAIESNLQNLKARGV